MAIKYYAGDRWYGTTSERTSHSTSNLVAGLTFLETNTDDVYTWDGDSWNLVSGNSIAQTFSNKTFGDHVTIAEISAPGTPSGGYGALYIKSSDSKIYFKNDGGTEFNLTEGQSEGGEANQNAYASIAVSGQSTIAADGETDTVTFIAGSNMTITTNASSGADEVTFAASSSSQNLFQTIAVSGQSNVVADSATDTLTLAGGSNITLTTNASTDTITIAASSSSATVTVTDNESTNENNLITFVADAATSTGAHGLEMDGDLHYNPSTGTLTSTVFVGALTGDVAGNASGTAATVTGAAQTAITSVGTLTGLDLTSGDKTIFATVGNNTLTIGASTTTVNIAGDLTVSGDATTFNTATVSVEDPLMILASNNNAADAVDIGFYGLYDTSGSLDLYSGIFRDANDSGKWKLFKDLQAAPTTTVNTSGTGYAVGTLVANVEGNITGSAGTSTGLAGSATVLATARTISASGDITWTSASFNGSANVTSVAAITADVIINADVKSDAAIAYSKLAALANGNILVGNGSNVATSVNPSGDIDVTNAGVFSIASGVIVNADVNASAAIVDTKLATIATANKVGLAALDIDGGTEIGAAIVDADLFIIDDGAGGTNRKVLASRLQTYIGTLGEANESSFKTIVVSGQSDVVADTATDTLTFAAGTGIALTTNAGTDTVTITNSATGASESFAIAMAVAL